MPDSSKPADDDQALAREFDVLAKRAGFPVLEPHRGALLKGYKDIRRMAALMRQPRTAADEPAGTYAMHSITRTL